VELEDYLFTQYANYSLRDNPDILYQLFQKIYQVALKDTPREEKIFIEKKINQMLAYVVEFSGYTSSEEIAYPNPGEWHNYTDYDWDVHLRKVAEKTIFYYEDDGCEEVCSKRILRIRVLGEGKLTGKGRVNCYECWRLYFANILSSLVSGFEYSKIEGFPEILNAYSNGGKGILISNAPQSSIFKEGLRESLDCDWNVLFLLSLTASECEHAFLSFLWTIVGHSLIEFLLHDDRRKLKRCEWCGNFFIASKIDKRFKYCPVCSPKSKLSKERKTELQRIRRKRMKEEKIAQIKAGQIKRYLEAGYTLKEAEDLWEEYRVENKL